MASKLALLIALGSTRPASACEFDLASIFGFLVPSVAVPGTLCRAAGEPPHQSGLWHYGFPVSSLPAAVCEGTIDVQQDGTICVTGRVSYAQIREAVGRPTYSPAAPTISINGHLTTGSCNVVLGPNAHFLYDFVTSYTVEGTEYQADATMIDRLLAASSGTIDGVCLDASFAPNGPDGYTIRSERWAPADVDLDAFATANLIFVSRYFIVAEFHEAADPWAGWDGLLGMLTHPPFLGGSTFSTAIGVTLYNTISFLSVPSFLVTLIPGFLGVTGLTRNLLISGTFNIDQHPLPLLAPPTAVENIQVDTEWATLLAAMDAGLFSNPPVPVDLGLVIKRITPAEPTNGCWTEPAAAIDIQAPMGKHAILDDWIRDVLHPALTAIGTVGLHFGKRLPAQSAVLQAALDKYEACGASVGLSLTECYHPMCKRTVTPTAFEYPSQYFKSL